MAAEISIFQDTFKNTPMAKLTVAEILDNIKNGAYMDDVEHVRKIRDEKGDKVYKRAKRNLKAVTFSGTFSVRKNDDKTFKHSSILLADIDNLNGQKDELRKKIEADPHTAFCFVSPSNDGLKVGVWFKQKPSNDVEHKRCFSLVESYFKNAFGVSIDQSCKDIARLCYVSYDPDLFRNPKAKSFNMPPETKPDAAHKEIPPEYKPTSQQSIDYAKNVIDRACHSIITAPDGEKHRTRLRMARLIGGYVGGGLINEDDAFEFLASAVSQSGTPERDLSAAYKTIRDGIAYGRELPITKEALDADYQNYISNNGNYSNNSNNKVFLDKLPLPPTLKLYLDSLYNSNVHANTENDHECRFKGEKMGQNDTLSDGMRNKNIAPKDPDVMRELIKNTQLPENIEKLINEWASNNSNNREQPSNNTVTTAVTTTQRTNITASVQEFILDSVGWFQVRDVYDAIGARTGTEKTAIRKALHKFSNDGTVERHQTKNGGYRRIDKDAPLMDFMNCKSEECSDFILPLDIHNMVSIMPGNIILIAGSPNSGKTSLLLNIAKDNMKNYKIYYWNSEMDEAELRLRLNKFEIPLSDWAKNGFEPRVKHGNFQDVIKPGVGNVNIIDFLEIHDEFYAVGGMIRQIYEKLDGAIAVIALQKDKGRDLGRGGAFTIEKPRLALAVDYMPEKGCGTIKIVKAKNFKSGINPNGMSMDFNIIDGAKIHPRQGWHR